MAYKVDLEAYSGPFDLLLYLIRQEEVDVYDIPIARILERYLEHLESGVHIDINNAGEFLVMASTLMEIKSRMLLPVADRPAEEEDEEDPRASLVRQLLAFRAFKEAAGRLGEMREVRQRRFSRARPVVLPGDERPPEPEPLKDVTLFDLADGYARLMKQTMGSGPRTILYDEVSVEDRVKAIIGALALRSEFALGALFGEGVSAVQAAGTFFALLELVRQRAVRVFQNVDFGEILVKKRGEEEEGEADLETAGAEPAGPYVEPTLPPPLERVPGGDGKPSRARPRPRFAGIGRAEEVDAPGADGAEGAEGAERDEADDEFIASDDAERRLSRRIDEILRHADEISARFEESRKRKGREAGGGALDLTAAAAAAASLDEAMSGLQAEDGAGAPREGGGDEAGADPDEEPTRRPSVQSADAAEQDEPHEPGEPDGPDGPDESTGGV